MKVAIFSTKSYDREYFEAFNEKFRLALTFIDAPLNKHTVKLTQGYEAVCIFVNDVVERNIIAKLAENGIRVIALRCAGFNNVDIQAAQEHNIKVVRVPAYSPRAVAEHAVALILTLNRKTHKAYNRIREHNFSLDHLTGFDLYGKTVGVIGTGMVGSVFCKIMLGFGCRITAFDLHPSEALQELGVQYISFEALLRQADIISLQCPLTPQTKHLINKDAYAKMKNGVMLINTSRGAVIHTKDTIKALKSGKLGYLGMDVYEQEEQLFFKDLSQSIIQDDLIARLMTFPNVLITAHQGFFTKEALEQIATTTLKNIDDVAKGRPIENEVKFK